MTKSHTVRRPSVTFADQHLELVDQEEIPISRSNSDNSSAGWRIFRSFSVEDNIGISRTKSNEPSLHKSAYIDDFSYIDESMIPTYRQETSFKSKVSSKISSIKNSVSRKFSGFSSSEVKSPEHVAQGFSSVLEKSGGRSVIIHRPDEKSNQELGTNLDYKGKGKETKSENPAKIVGLYDRQENSQSRVSENGIESGKLYEFDDGHGFFINSSTSPSVSQNTLSSSKKVKFAEDNNFEVVRSCSSKSGFNTDSSRFHSKKVKSEEVTLAGDNSEAILDTLFE